MNKPIEQSVVGYGIRGSEYVVFWCHHCGEKHRYCDPDIELGLGARVDRCDREDSPLDLQGFRIDVIGILVDEDDVRPSRLYSNKMISLRKIFKIYVKPKYPKSIYVGMCNESHISSPIFDDLGRINVGSLEALQSKIANIQEQLNQVAEQLKPGWTQ